MPYFENPETKEITFTLEDVKGIKAMKDGSVRFKFLGGPYHNMVFRVYPPYDTVVWPNGLAYELTPPPNFKKSDRWVYVHSMELSAKNAIRAARGEPFDVE